MSRRPRSTTTRASLVLIAALSVAALFATARLFISLDRFATHASTAATLPLVAPITASPTALPTAPPVTLPPSPYSLTIISTALVLGPIQLAAIYTWVHYAGAHRIILFVDHPVECQESLNKANLGRFVTVARTPNPVSTFSGKVRFVSANWPQRSRTLERACSLASACSSPRARR